MTPFSSVSEARDPERDGVSKAGLYGFLIVIFKNIFYLKIY
jgi:hypothetical protein